MHNNYFLQVQTLINQKALSAPSGSARKAERPVTKTESSSHNDHLKTESKRQNVPLKKTAQKEKPLKKADKPTEKAEKEPIEKICKNCNQTFFTENPRKETCSDSCRQSFFRTSRRNKGPWQED